MLFFSKKNLTFFAPAFPPALFFTAKLIQTKKLIDYGLRYSEWPLKLRKKHAIEQNGTS